MLAVLIRILSFVAMVYLFHRLLKAVFALFTGSQVTKSQSRDKQKIIDVCPDCGHVLAPGHKCFKEHS